MTNLPSSKNLIRKALHLSLNNIWRNKFLSLATIFVIGTIIFIFNIILSINFIAKEAISDLSQKIDVTVYLQDTTTYEQIQTIQNELKTVEGIKEIVYVSKEQALAKIKTTHPDLSLAFEKYSLGNPLPASLNITTIHPKYHEKVAAFLGTPKYQSYLSSIVTASKDGNSGILTSVTKNLLKLSNFANQIIFWLVMIFIVGGALIILNAIQIAIFSRRREIEVMKVVGAPQWFIRLPYLTESVIYGLLAVILSFIMLYALANQVEIDQSSLKTYYANLNFFKIFLFELLATTVLSVISSLLAVHEHIYEKRHR